jgi:hypothetical protein
MADRQRLDPPKQTLDDAYAAPANFLEVDVVTPQTHGVGKKRYTDYEVRMRVRNVSQFSAISLNCSVVSVVHFLQEASMG